jgi:hypothetical protein
MKINRNNIVGDYLSFAPKRISIKDLISDHTPPRPPLIIRQIEEYSLVRYYLGSKELRLDLETLGVNHWVDADRAMITSIFGVKDNQGKLPLKGGKDDCFASISYSLHSHRIFDSLVVSYKIYRLA